MRVALVYPELLGTYGDGGNALVLVERARRRGVAAELVTVTLDDALPRADVYLLGGGEDGPQRLAADLLGRADLAGRVGDGSVVVAVCAGLQILGTSFAVEGEDNYQGVGLVAATTRRGARRAVGDLVVRVGDHLLVGFENHGGVTDLGEGVAPLGEVVRGRGSDGARDGYRAARLWATYAHGPVLALNPWLADEVLSAALGTDLEPLATTADALYAERCASLAP